MKYQNWSASDFHFHVSRTLKENGMSFNHPRSLSAQKTIFERLGYPVDSPLLLLPIEGWEAFAAMVEKFDYEQFLSREKAA